MKYRSFGSLDWKVSALGFGRMRLPRLADGSGLDEEKAIPLLRRAVDEGVNYFDTAYIYPGSEVVLGKALLDGYRDRVRIATKLYPGPIDRILADYGVARTEPAET